METGSVGQAAAAQSEKAEPVQKIERAEEEAPKKEAAVANTDAAVVELKSGEAQQSLAVEES